MQFLEMIKIRQKKVSCNLSYLNENLSVICDPTNSGKELSKGCQTCKNGTWWCLYVGQKCNLNCKYCPQGDISYKISKIDDERAMQRLWIDDIKIALKVVAPGTIRGVSYSGGEPFMYLQKIIEMATFITENFGNDIYQWIYTNGVLATYHKMQILNDIGIKEIRFHIGADNFNESIISKLQPASKIFPTVTVETPSCRELKTWGIDNDGFKRLEQYGVHQINLSELYLIEGVGQKGYEEEEVYQYTSMFRGLHISPTFSRIITYDIMEYFIKNNINILINDCSHQSRDAQIYTRQLNKNRLPEMY